MLLTHFIRDALLEPSLLDDAPPPSAELYERLYREASSLIHPSATPHLAPEAFRYDHDQALLSEYLQGDISDFKALMERHLKWMVTWARRYLPNAEAEDAAQEAFIALVHKADRIEAGATLRSFLFGLLRIAVLRAQRARARHLGEAIEGEGDESHALVDPRPDPEVTFLTRRSYQELAKALSDVCGLREQEVVLHTLEGQDDAAIAEALGLSANNVRVIRHRALARLRQALNAPAREGGAER